MLQNPRKMLPWLCRIRSFYNTSLHLHQFPIASFSTSTHQFSPECASNLSSLSATNYLTKPRNADSVLNFLKDNGFAKNHLETIIQKAPWILSANLEKSVKPKLKIFQDLGFHSTELADIISISPWLLKSSAERLRLSFLGIKNVLGPNVDICRFLKSSGGGRCLAGVDLDTTLLPNVEYLKSCGICSLHIARYIYLSSMTFFIQPDKFKDIVKRVDEMGFDRQSKMFLCAVKVMDSMSRKNWELKLDVFRELGFSDENISNAFRVSPQAFGVSERKIKEITQLLLSVEEFSISDIVSNPVLLTYSVEKRFKPRLRVLKALESKNLLKRRPSFNYFFKMTDADFTNKYMIPYSDELGDLYVATQGS